MKIPEDYYVYLLYEPGMAEPFYCGKGIGDRAWAHLRPSEWARCWNACHRKIKALLDRGIKYEVDIVQQGLTESEAMSLETATIKRIGRKDLGTGPLLNHTDGGEGSSGYEFSEESKRKMSKAKLGRIDPKRKPIVGLMFGTIVERFDSIWAARDSGYIPVHIRGCLTGRRKLHQGIEWRYADEKEISISSTKQSSSESTAST